MGFPPVADSVLPGGGLHRMRVVGTLGSEQTQVRRRRDAELLRGGADRKPSPDTPNPNQSDLDGDGQGDPCDSSDARFNLTSARFVQTRVTVTSGRITLKGDVVTSPPRDTFDTAAGIEIHITDGYRLDQTYSWGANACLVS